jgi:ABC-type sulfate/molybdate transport systems ATPase subunit
VATLAGLLPPAAGTVTSEGRVATALQTAAMARRTVRANLELALRWWGVPRDQRAARASEALARLDASHLADRRATELSGGEARRVHLARAIAVPAEVLLLDEPLAGLDAHARAALLDDAPAVLRRPDRAVLLVVHDRAEAWALADRLLVLLDGRIAADGPPGRLLDAPPSPAVARFLGFSGQIVEPDGGVRCLRPGHVRLVGRAGAGSGRAGTVTGRVPEEDGVLCEVAVDGGRVGVRAAYPGPAIGERVTVAVDGGARFAPEA